MRLSSQAVWAVSYTRAEAFKTLISLQHLEEEPWHTLLETVEIITTWSSRRGMPSAGPKARCMGASHWPKGQDSQYVFRKISTAILRNIAKRVSEARRQDYWCAQLCQMEL